MLNRNGQVLGPSSHYHHRRTLERLGLLVKQDHFFTLNEHSMEAMLLTTRQSIGKPLDDEEKRAFSNVLLRNRDCHDMFFQHFLETDTVVKDVSDFVERGRPVELRVLRGLTSANQSTVRESLAGSDATKPDVEVAMRAVETQDWCVHFGTNAVQAIHFGLRGWCVDQLGFLDGMFTADGLYTIFPKQIAQSLTTQELALHMLNSLKFQGEWTTVRVGDFALQMGIEQRASIEQTKGVLAAWLNDHPDIVAGIPINERFITGGLANRQRTLALEGFLLGRGGAYVSHLRIHQDIYHIARRGVAQS